MIAKAIETSRACAVLIILGIYYTIDDSIVDMIITTTFEIRLYIYVFIVKSMYTTHPWFDGNVNGTLAIEIDDLHAWIQSITTIMHNVKYMAIK